MQSMRRSFAVRVPYILSLAMLIGAAPAVAQDTDDVKRAKQQRNGAGLSVGLWNVRGLEERSGVDESRSPTIEGYFAKGLDLHLTLENTLGLWIRTQKVPASGGLGGASEETIRSYIIPQFTAVRFYPVSRPDDQMQPFVGAGLGFAFGIDDRETTGGGLLGDMGGSGIAFVPGFGLKAHAGTEFRGKALGLSLSARYQWIRFFQEVGGEQTFGGLGADIGFVYRFQYR